MATPEDYNANQLESGDLTIEGITAMVSYWQEGHDLEVDGYCGPKTIATLRPELGDPSGVSALALGALAVARESLGKGEVGGNNSGPFVEMLHGKVFDGSDDDDGPWCSALMSMCFATSAERLGIDLPFRRSGGAKRLFKNVSAAGRSITPDSPGFDRSARIGDLMCWQRGDPGSYMGHIGIVERVDGSTVHTIEGNVGRFPSKVRRFRHDLDDPRLIGFARI